MNRDFNLRQSAKLCAAALLLLCANAHAQSRNQATQNVTAVLPLPYGVEQLIADDAHGSLFAEIAPDATDSGGREYHDIEVKHVYPGGIARLFGGVVIPAGSLLSPEFNGTMPGSVGRPFSVSGIGSPQNAGQFPLQGGINSPVGQPLFNGFLQGTTNR